jgi:hypothetical protein
MDIAALRSRFDADPEGFRVTKEDIEEWRSQTNLPLDDLCDEIAWLLAVGFNSGQLPFLFCDEVINHMHGIMVQVYLPEVPRLHLGIFWEVYLAFDSGEFHAHLNDDPVEDYTKPFIRKILAHGRKGDQSR